MVSIVVAHSRNMVIGRNGGLPWHLRTDLKRFKQITSGGTVVMGRRTFESLPEAFRPLPDRRNLVLSTQPKLSITGAEVYESLDKALRACAGDCFIIGGGATYADSIGYAERVFATEIQQDVEGDTYFPELSPAEWACVEQEPEIVEDGFAYSFKTYSRPRLYDLSAARSPEQRAHMARLEADGVCIFCADHVHRYHDHPIEWSGDHWYVTRNAYPYPGTVAHFLIVPHLHVSSFDELPDAAGAELWKVKRMLKEQIGARAYATVERSGDMRLNGGSVAHVHTHFVVLAENPAQTVRFRVSAPGED